MTHNSIHAMPAEVASEGAVRDHCWVVEVNVHVPTNDAVGLLFSYGTLRQHDVQLETFGRLLEGTPDAITGFVLGEVVITDDAVVRRSGSDRHPILRAAEASARIEGTAFRVTDADIAAADAYEVSDYRRIRVDLESGASAWMYAFHTEGAASAEV